MNNDELAKQLSTLVKSYVDLKLSGVEKFVDELVKKSTEELSLNLKQMIESIPPGIDGKDGEPGIDGKDGVDGKDGAAGSDGEPGKDGSDGTPGKDGSDGTNGVDGKNGENGTDGQDGKNGEDGKDALAISILPSIEEGKAYPRGTYAIHKGGLWHSFRKTNKMSGWECVVDGLADISVEYDGERGFKITHEKSSGERIEKDFELPMLIHKDIWRAEKSYKRFDVVTYGGSMWYALKDAPDGAPQVSDDWRLSVKRGRDANTPVKV